MPAEGTALRIIFSGETQGELEPCNCTGGMAGGLPVRGGYIAAQKGPLLLVDTGCVGNGARDFEVLRAQAALRAMKTMGYHAVNVGEKELWLGADGLRALGETGVPFVSANVVAAGGVAPFSAHVVVKVGALDVAVTGIVAPSYAPGPGLTLESPSEALGRLVPKLRAAAGVIIVLADLDLAALRELAETFPEITAILFRGRGDAFGPERVNRTLLASVYGETLFLGDMTLTWGAGGAVSAAAPIAVRMETTLPKSEAVARDAIAWYKDAVKGKTFDLARPLPGDDRIRAFRPEPGNGFVGSDACKTCHAGEHAQWASHRHARAMQSLVRAGYEWSPECIVCHVVGYGAPDGYVSQDATPVLANVGCESCHGAGKALLGGKCAGVARKATEETCARCHTPKHHPGFNYAGMRGSVDHRGTEGR